jgi:GDSL-like Lipase/Acylhydrolase family
MKIRIRGHAALRPLRAAALACAAMLTVPLLAATGAEADTAAVVNVVNFGDSYAAGNGTGAYYGPSHCYRSHQNYAEQVYRGLATPGWLVDSSCSGAASTTVLAQVDALPQSVGDAASITFVSVGGDDNQYFAHIVTWCYGVPPIIADSPRGGIDATAAACDRDITAAENALKPGSAVLGNVRGVLHAIASKTPHAKVIVVGYPHLHVQRTATDKRIATLVDSYSARQREMVAAENAGSGGGRFVFEDRVPLFGGHEVGSSQPYMRGILATGIKMEWFHPNLAGWNATAADLVAKGARDGLPTFENAASAGPLHGDVIRTPAGASWVVDAAGNRHALRDGGAYQCAVAQGRIVVTVTAALAGALPLGAPMDPWCFSPKAALGSVLRTPDGKAYLADLAQPAVLGAVVRRSVTTSASFRCLVAQGRVVHNLLDEDLARIPMDFGRPVTCVAPGEVVGKIVVDPADNSSWMVDRTAGKPPVRHHVVDTATFACLTGRGITVNRDLEHDDVASIAAGADQHQCIKPSDYVGAVLRQTDGHAFLVTNQGRRLPVPTGGDYLCLVEYQRHRVVEATAAQVASVPAGSGAATCAVDVASLFGKIMRRSSDGAAWYVDSDRLRHWIQDTQTWYALTDRGVQVLDGFSFAGANLVPEGSFEPRALSPQRYKHTIVRRTDGTSWMVDDNGQRHWLRSGWDFDCYRDRGYPVAEHDLAGEQAASLSEGGEAAGCLSVADAAGTIIREGSTGTSYYVDGAGVRHWLADGWTYEALQVRGVRVLSRDLTWDEVGSLPEGPRQPLAIAPAHIANTLLRFDNGVIDFVDGGGTRHWVPDILTAQRLQELGYGYSFNSMAWETAASIPEGGWQPRALPRWLVRGHVVRATDGTAYYVTSDDLWHWIKTGDLYNWLVAHHGFAGTYAWDQLNSIRHEGNWAGYW